MYSDLGLILLPIAIIFIWLGILSFLYLENRKFLTSLFPKSGDRDIRKKLEEVAGIIEKSNSRLDGFQDTLKGIEKKGEGYISRMDLMRYNPYDETGGDMSFSIALLDKAGSGVVVTSLHSRSGTRVFGKPVLMGRSSGYNFSKEEEAVIKKAMSK